jgi:Flp pilus assembly protein TadG
MWHEIKSGLLRSVRRYAKSDSGVAAVEFAFVGLPFMLMIMIIVEQCTMMFAEYTLQAAVQEAARLIRTGQAQSTALTAADFKTKVCRIAKLIIQCSSNVTVYVASDTDFATLQSKLPSFLNVGYKDDGTPGTPPSYTCGGPLMTTAVVATYDWKFIMPGMGFNSNMGNGTKKRLVGFAMFENEPFPAGTTCK